MPLVPFDSLPDDARVWVFATDRALDDAEAARLLAETDRYLAQWKAHGEPLTVARDFREHRFLTIAVDQRDAHASGCSVDGLYRAFKSLERDLGTGLVSAGRVHFRAADGTIRTVDRDEFTEHAAAGIVTPRTPVFDPSVTTLGDWRRGFEKTVGESWHAQLL